MRRIRRPVYEEVLECEYCGSIWTPRGSGKFIKCSVCKKEGCSNCSARISPTGEEYIYHEKCYKRLPKSILKVHQEHIDEYDAQREWSKYINGC